MRRGRVVVVLVRAGRHRMMDRSRVGSMAACLAMTRHIRLTTLHVAVPSLFAHAKRHLNSLVAAMATLDQLRLMAGHSQSQGRDWSRRTLSLRSWQVLWFSLLLLLADIQGLLFFGGLELAIGVRDALAMMEPRCPQAALSGG